MNDTNKSRHQMTRREMLKLMGTTAAVGAIGFSPSLVSNLFAGPQKPNVVFILGDDHRWDHLGCAGHPFLQTPNLDRLADQGVLFKNAFVTTSLCSPSRASFLTGTYAHTHGVKNNITPWTGKQKTFLEGFKEAGYATAFIGKWHMPGDGLPKLPYLDLFVSFTEKSGQGLYYNCPLYENGVKSKSRKEYITEELTDRAIRFIRSNSHKPFSLVLSHKAAHNMYLPPGNMKNLYTDEKIDMPDDIDIWTPMTQGNIYEGHMGLLKMHYRNYCRTLTGLDYEIGRLLDAIDKLGLQNNTVVVYAGDNGLLWGEHRHINKYWHYEESIRIPFIIRAPWLSDSKGTKRDQLVLNIDLAPTLWDIAGIQRQDPIEGQSLVPIIKKRDAAIREAFLFEYYKNYPYPIPTYYGVRTQKHKYVEFEGGMEPELYNLAVDPHEKDNLYEKADAAHIQKELCALLKNIKPRK
ncbi:MAG: sulfatase-like hydrolase/transferase [Thermodesulfobacteriota bacterium]|nr:sulfatase-like hydrolase/transferase [Thermodesulfobacteriota bacterium]